MKIIQLTKKLIFIILCNEFTGFVISRIFSNKIPNLRTLNFSQFIDVKSDFISNTVKGMIFWGFYESAEIRLIQKNLTNELHVVELGSSIGVVSQEILKKLNHSKKLICVEANPFLIDKIKSNTSQYKNIQIVNAALSYNENQEVSIAVSRNNTESRIKNEINHNKNSIVIPTVKLSELINESFILISDIEGSEVDFLLNDSETLSKCKKIFIELHSTSYKDKIYDIEELDKLIRSYGFELEDRDGFVFYYLKKS
jgi:FkbM family methyltransferase